MVLIKGILPGSDNMNRFEKFTRGTGGAMSEMKTDMGAKEKHIYEKLEGLKSLIKQPLEKQDGACP